MKHAIVKYGRKWVVAEYNKYHDNYLVEDLKDGWGFGRTPGAAIRACYNRPVTYRTRAEAEAEAQEAE